MLRILFFIVFFIHTNNSYSFISLEAEEKDRVCNDFIYKIHSSRGEYSPNFQTIKEKLGLEKTRTKHTYTYHWKNLTVIFLDDKYLDHYGAMKIDSKKSSYLDITPEDLEIEYGKPIRISYSTNNVKSWKCRYTLSNLEIVINEFDQILRYTGRYCSINKPDYCQNFDYISKQDKQSDLK